MAWHGDTLPHSRARLPVGPRSGRTATMPAPCRYRGLYGDYGALPASDPMVHYWCRLDTTGGWRYDWCRVETRGVGVEGFDSTPTSKPRGKKGG